MANYLEGAASVFGEAALDPLSLTPNATAEQFRQTNPLTAAAIEFGGFLVPYSGWTKIAKSVGVFDKIAKSGLGSVQQSAVKGLAYTAPVDALRVVTAGAWGEDGEFGSALAEGVIFGGAGAALGAAGGALRLRFKDSSYGSIVGKTNATEPLQHTRRKARLNIIKWNKENPNQTDPQTIEKRGELNSVMQKIDRTLLEEKPQIAAGLNKGSPNYVRKELSNFDSRAESQTYSKFLNRLFTRAEVFDQSTRSQTWQKIFGLEGQVLEHTQYARLLKAPKFKGKGGGELSMEQALSRMTKLEEGVFALKESDGLYVVAKKGLHPITKVLPNGDTVENLETRWLLAKTDNLKFFAKKSAPFTSLIEDSQAFFREAPAGVTAKRNRDYISEFDLPIELAPAAEPQYRTFMGKQFRTSQLGQKVKETAERYLAPQTFQLRGNAMGRTLLAGLQNSGTSAGARAQKYLFGTANFNPKHIGKQALLGGTQKTEGLVDKFRAFDKEALADYNQIVAKVTGKSLDSEIVKNLEGIEAFLTFLEKDAGRVFSPLAKAAVRDSHRIFNELGVELRQLANVSGERFYQHPFYIQNREPAGRFIKRITDKNGRLIQYVSANSQKEVDELAHALVKEAGSEGLEWGLHNPYVTNSQIERDFLVNGQQTFSKNAETLERLIDSLALQNRKWAKYRYNVLGYKTNYTIKELIENATQTIGERTRQIEGEAWRQEAFPLLQKLDVFGKTHELKILESRYNQLKGLREKGIVEKEVDRVLEPYFGVGGTQKAVTAFNKAQFLLTLGFGRLDYSTMTMATFLQTGFPEMFAAVNAKGHLTKYYDNLAVPTQAGVKQLGLFNSLKLQREVFKQLNSPDPELFENLNKALKAGNLAPLVLAEGGIGAKLNSLDTIKGSWKAGERWKAFEQVAELNISGPERLSRTHAFTTAHLLGKEFLGLEGEQLYRFSSQFTDRTMYRYSAGDRSHIFEGPFGSALGLFKTWAINYLFNAGVYAGAATRGGSVAPLVALFGGAGALTGLRGSPGYAQADQLSQLFTNEHLMENIYQNFNREGDDPTQWSDAVFLGMTTLLPDPLSFSLTSSAAAPGNELMRDLNYLFSVSALNRAKYVGKALENAGNYISATGELDVLSDANTRGALFQAALPKVLQRAMSVTDENLKSLTTGYGRDELSLPERVLYTLGFSPTEVERKQHVSAELYQDLTQRRKATSAYGERWAELTRAKDSRGLEELRTDALGSGLDLDAIIQSSNNRIERFEGDNLYRFKQDDIVKRIHSLQGLNINLNEG